MKKTTFNITTALLIAFALLAAPVAAVEDPLGCSTTGVGISLAVFRADGTTPILGGGTVQSGETIKYRTTLSFDAGPGTNCNFQGGTLTITTPDGVVHNVVVGVIPLVSNGNPYTSEFADYVVSESNVVGGFLAASTNYNGFATDGVNSPLAASTGISRVYQDSSLQVTKTAVESLTRTVQWTIEKSADPTSHNLTDGESEDSTWTVTVTKGQTIDSGFGVTGTITIHNPAQFATAVVTDVTDVITGPVNGVVDCPGDFPTNILPGADLVCTYSAALPDDTERTNTATVTTSGDVGGGSDDEVVDFTGASVNLVNDQITVDDTNLNGNLGVTNHTTSWMYDETFTCDGIEYVEGTGQKEKLNTATIVETNQQAQATVTTVCHEIVDVSCTYTQGYWKTHSMSGPAGPYDDGWQEVGNFDGDGNVAEEEKENFFLSGKTWLQVFRTPVKGNPYYSLAHQWMAAYLNINSGASVPVDVQNAFDAGQTFLESHSPNTVKNSKVLKAQATALAGILGSYNEGLIGPGHCGDEVIA